jgi:hypothetical protein
LALACWRFGWRFPCCRSAPPAELCASAAWTKRDESSPLCGQIALARNSASQQYCKKQPTSWAPSHEPSSASRSPSHCECSASPRPATTRGFDSISHAASTTAVAVLAPSRLSSPARKSRRSSRWQPRWSTATCPSACSPGTRARIGRVFAAPATWARLIRERGWRRPRQRVYPAKPKTGIRASRPNEIWHIDMSVIRLLDGTRTYLHAIIDTSPGASWPGS